VEGTPLRGEVKNSHSTPEVTSPHQTVYLDLGLLHAVDVPLLLTTQLAKEWGHDSSYNASYSKG
jgi:hypothetical protein